MGWVSGASAPSSCFDGSYVDLSHSHHGFECAPGRCSIRICDRSRQGTWRDLPRHSPLVLAPAAYAFLAPVSDNRVPQTVCFGLIVGRDLERECFVVLER